MLDNLGNLERTHSCGELRSEDVGKPVVLMGWVARRRDFGPLTFIDLRDRDGITQVVFNEETAPDAHARAKEVRGEYVIAVTGEVVLRAEGQRNPKIATGEVEVSAREILVLNDARTPPFQLEVTSSDGLASEDLRLKYRYLDLRRPQLQANLHLRHRTVAEIRRYMDEQSFTEIETPILIKSTPEGARDYIVPSRIQPGKFYALPQSPQLFKQLCMIAGFDKYYQIARCFRDEDLRADRQPEFTQLDVELSFANTEMVYRLVEGLFPRVFKLVGAELETPFPRLTYAEAMRRYGSDKPDLRFEMELQDLSGVLEGTTFAPFASVLESKGEIKGIVVPDGAKLSRKVLDELQEFAKRYGAGALGWIKLGDELSSSLLKALGQETIQRLAHAAGAGKGDAVLIVAGRPKVVAASLGALRVEVARREKLIPEGVYKPLWVTEFPMFEFHEEDGRYYAVHHPFTAPLDEDLPLFRRAVEENETKLLGQLRAKAYDAVVNGVETAGGSIRIHQRDVQNLVFRAIGLTKEMARERFGFFLDALEYGTPPHGGIASGIERLLMSMTGIENIRDLMAFPKTASAADLMIDAPGEVDPAQLDELGIRITKGKGIEALIGWLLDPQGNHGLGTFPLQEFIGLVSRQKVHTVDPAKQVINWEELSAPKNIITATVDFKARPFDLFIRGIKYPPSKNVELVIELKSGRNTSPEAIAKFITDAISYAIKKNNEHHLSIPILIAPKREISYLVNIHHDQDLMYFGVDYESIRNEIIQPCLEHHDLTEVGRYRLQDYDEMTR